MPYEMIRCRIFRNSDQAAKDLLARLNSRGKGMPEKARLAASLRGEAETLLACGEYHSQVQDCKNCRVLSERRKMLAELILQRAANPALALSHR